MITLPAAGHGELALDGTAVTRTTRSNTRELGDLVFTPVANWHGQASFTFKVVDQSDAASATAATATVTVSSVADAPVAAALSKSTAEDTVLTFAAADFDGVFTDGDGRQPEEGEGDEPAGVHGGNAGAGRRGPDGDGGERERRD